jgi:hypothetical protein
VTFLFSRNLRVFRRSREKRKKPVGFTLIRSSVSAKVFSNRSVMFFRYNNFSKFVVRTVYNFWKASSRASDADGAPSLHMSRLCAMLQWSSEFLCKCLLAANKAFFSINWQPLVHEAYADFIANQSRLNELFVSEYKLRDEGLKRAYESYSDILLSHTTKNSMM